MELLFIVPVSDCSTGVNLVCNNGSNSGIKDGGYMDNVMKDYKLMAEGCVDTLIQLADDSVKGTPQDSVNVANLGTFYALMRIAETLERIEIMKEEAMWQNRINLEAIEINTRKQRPGVGD